MDIEPMDHFEEELKDTLARRPAPPSLKRRILQAREAQRSRRFWNLSWAWQPVAASIVLAGVLGGTYVWQEKEQQRKGEEARRQVMTALRITSHALDEMNLRLAAHSRADRQ